MDKTITEKRQFPRINAAFPIQITPEFLGQTMDFSEGGLRFALQKPLLLSKAKARIEISPEESIETEFKVIWAKHLVTDGKFCYGACFIRLKEKDLATLRKVLSSDKGLDERFVDLTSHFRDYLRSIKNRFDKFDLEHSNERDRINFVESEKSEIFKKLDMYFHRTWEIVRDFEKDRYKIHKHCYQEMLDHLIITPIEINRHIRQKPLGYSGDFFVMNYIYNYHEDREKVKYLGTSSFEKLVNNYTCNIPFSTSNIIRKDFFKSRILEIMDKIKDTKLLSVGCGSMRELLELLDENKINKNLKFYCLDFEKKALNYVKNEIDKIGDKKKKFLDMHYFHNNVVDIIRNKRLKEELDGKDLIYVSGVFDYLKDRFALRLIKHLYQLLNKEGILIICNASKENYSHRAYYEMLGEWNMMHRTKEELLSWTNEISNIAEIKFEQPAGFVNYWFLSIKKL